MRSEKRGYCIQIKELSKTMNRLINILNWDLSGDRRGENGLINVFKDKIAVHRSLSVFRSQAYDFSSTDP